MSFTDLEREFSDVCLSKNDGQSVIQLDDHHLGWFHMVETLLESIRSQGDKISVIRSHHGKLDVDLISDEKYGSWPKDTSYEISEYATKLSAKTCSNCGKPGQLREKDGQYFTICDSCSNGLELCPWEKHFNKCCMCLEKGEHVIYGGNEITICYGCRDDYAANHPLDRPSN